MLKNHCPEPRLAVCELGRYATHSATDYGTGERVELRVVPDQHGLTIETPDGRIVILDVCNGEVSVAVQNGEDEDNCVMGTV